MRALSRALATALAACGLAGLAQAACPTGAVTTTATASGACTDTLFASGGTIDATAGVQITTTANSAAGVRAFSGGTVNLDHSTISTSGYGSYGMATNYGGPTVTSSITASNTDIATTGDAASGVWANYGSTVDLTNVTISTQGIQSYGIRIYGYEFETLTAAPVSVTGTNVTINTVASWGVADQGGDASLTLTDSSITSTGNGGLYVSEDNTSATLTNTKVTSGASKPAAYVSDAATLTATGSTFNGATDAIDTGDDDSTGTPATVNITGGTLTANGGDAIHTSTSTNLSLAGAITVTASTGNLLNNDSGGTTTLTATGATFAGDIATDAASTTDVTLDAASKWTLPGGSSTVTSLTNNGAITLGKDASGTLGSLTVTGAYDSATGAIAVNAADLKGKPLSDFLILGGTVSGVTNLQIQNLSAIAGTATGSEITLLAGLNPANFTLSGPAPRVGNYVYALGACSGGSGVCLESQLQPLSTSAAVPTLDLAGLALLALALALSALVLRQRRQFR